MRRATAAFTLIETMAVVIGIALVFTTALGAYQGIQNQAFAAGAATEAPRRATALLDRMAREIEGTVLVKKPDEADPLDHPWVFLAESQTASNGADRVRFQTRSHRPRAEAAHVSDLLDVAWFTTPAEFGEGHDLWRWTSSRLPEQLERRFPRSDSEGSQPWARGIAELGIRLLDADGGWAEEWDSSTLVRSSQLPVAAEITVAFVNDDPEGPIEPYTRRVNFALGVIDLEAALSPEEEEFDAVEEEEPFDAEEFDDEAAEPSLPTLPTSPTELQLPEAEH